MSFQDIQRVTRIEEDTREKKLQAQAQARQIIAEAQKAGTAAVEAARRQARDQVSQWMEEVSGWAGRRRPGCWRPMTKPARPCAGRPADG